MSAYATSRSKPPSQNESVSYGYPKGNHTRPSVSYTFPPNEDALGYPKVTLLIIRSYI